VPSGPWKSAALFPASALSLKTLPNGVRVVTRATRGTGLACVQVWARAGSRFETEAESGAAHLVEALALRASRSFPRVSGELNGGAADAIEALGGQVSSQTSRDATFYSATVEASLLPQAMRALSDAVLHPQLGDAAVEEAKLEVLLQQQGRESDPLASVADLAYRAAFSRHPYRKPAGGSSLNIETLLPGQVRSFHAKRYVPRNLSVVIVGDVAPAQAQALALKYLGAAPAKPGVKTQPAPEVAPQGYKQVVRRRAINRTAVALAFRAPGIAQAQDVVAMDVLLASWREGTAAALRRALLSPRDGKESSDPTAAPPLALGYDVDFLTQRDPGLFIVTMAVEPDDRGAAVEATLREVERVEKQGLGADELARAKRLLRQQYLAQGETVSGQAGALGFYEMIDTYRFALTYLDRIERITDADVQRAAAKYLSRTNYLQCVIEPTPGNPDSPTGEPRRPVITAQLPTQNAR
jgi:zinc protease